MNKKLVNALSYFSILFAPVLLPLIVWIVATERDLKNNARNAFWLQTIPTLFAIISVIVVSVIGLTTGNTNTVGWITILLFLVFGVLSVVLFVYDLVLGVKSLMD